jgi:hypothetical protein
VTGVRDPLPTPDALGPLLDMSPALGPAVEQRLRAPLPPRDHRLTLEPLSPEATGRLRVRGDPGAAAPAASN